jgi:hypothetical protein
MCLACHGGDYDTTYHTVYNTSFLAFDVFNLLYSSVPGFTGADQEASFRALNSMVWPQTRRLEIATI